MKKLIALILVLMLYLGVAVPVTAENSGELYTVTVRAIDTNGEAVPDAEIRFMNITGVTLWTESAGTDGCWSGEVPGGVYRIRVINPADGYSVQDRMEIAEEEELEYVIPCLQKGSSITVGTFTKPLGWFAMDMFGNNSTDLDIRELLHGYSTISFTTDNTYAVNGTAVELLSAGTDDSGNRIYSFRVKDGLTYNDGTPITAADYVFSVLLQSSAALKELGAKDNRYQSLFGYDEYAAGESVFSGVRLMDDNQFSLMIDSRYLPYFYEMTYVNVTPYPISVIAPGYSVADEGKGAYLTIDGSDASQLPVALLKATLMGEEGYLHHPSVSAGSYSLVDYDAENGTVVLQYNEKYLGNYEGRKTSIETLILRTVKASEVLTLLESGEVDIVNKVSDSEIVEAGNALVREGILSSSNYLRNGLGFVSFACEQGPTADVSVRQAIAHALDRNGFVADYNGNNGMPVYSWYGLGQWMAEDYLNEIGDLVETYAEDETLAIEKLEAAGYTLNEFGETWKIGDGIRYRELTEEEASTENSEDAIVKAVVIGNKTCLPLQLRIAVTEGSRSGEVLEKNLVERLRKLGFDAQVVPMAFDELLKQYYREEKRTCNAFMMGSNFNLVFDVAEAFRADDQAQNQLNTTGIRDERLAKAAQMLDRTEPGAVENYTERWLTLMKIYSKLIPALPIYSNVYTDFYSAEIEDYYPNSNWSWGSAIQYSQVTE